MTLSDLANRAAGRANSAVDEITKGYAARAYPREEDISAALIGVLWSKFNGRRFAGFRWSASILNRRRGIASEEGIVGADMLIHVGLSTPTVSYSKGVLIQAKRKGAGVALTSNEHARLYFALAGPSHALTQNNFDAVWSATEAGPKETEALLLQLHTEAVTGSLSKTEVLFERLRGGTHDMLAGAQGKNLLVGISNAMDKAYRLRAFDVFWMNSLWDRAERLVPVLLSRLGVDERKSTLEAMFKNGEAIGWLTKLFRRETFAHGRHGNRLQSESDWLITDPELDRVTEVMISRYQSMPEAMSLLFAWQQGGDEDGPMRLVESRIKTDEGLVETLECMTTTVTSSNRGAYPVLQRNNLAPFLDYDRAKARITNLPMAGVLGERAQRLVKAFEDADNF